MFAKENRYITRGIAEGLELPLQILLWNLIDNMKIEKDYLQVFKLSRNAEVIIVEHSQEVPKYKSTIIINVNGLTFEGELKVYAIDSREYNMLLLAEEY